MGGFTFNGIGATDHFKKVKSLGVHTCPNCGKDAEFFLENAKFKIDIFFIPTVTLKSRYTVMCSRCKSGQVCSDAWASRLMSSSGPYDVIFESESRKIAQSSVQQTVAPPVTPEPVAAEPVAPVVSSTVKKAQSTHATFFKCPKCGVTQLREGPFCSYCGSPAPPEETPVSTAPLNGTKTEAGE